MILKSLVSKTLLRGSTNLPNGVVVRASALQSIALRVYFPKRVIPNDFKTWYLLIAAQQKPIVKRTLVMTLSKTLNGMSPSLCGRQVAGPSSLPFVAAQFNCRLAKRVNKKLKIWKAFLKMKDLVHKKKKKKKKNTKYEYAQAFYEHITVFFVT